MSLGAFLKTKRLGYTARGWVRSNEGRRAGKSGDSSGLEAKWREVSYVRLGWMRATRH